MRLLDLYCGEGLAAWGYWRSGRFSEIAGVDINPALAKRYAFDFVCADVMSLDYDFLMSFDFIHASPPCQGYSKATPDKSKHMRLVAATHLMLTAAGKPYVIENVEGSSRELRPNFVFDGFAVGLNIERRRYFHVSYLSEPYRNVEQRGGSDSIHANALTREDFIKVFNLHDYIPEVRLRRLTKQGIKEGIPPAMTYCIARDTLPPFLIT